MSKWLIGLVIGSALASSANAQNEGDVVRRWKTGVTRSEWRPSTQDFTITLSNPNPSAAIEVKQFLIEETAEQYVVRAARREETWVWEERSRKVCTRPDGSVDEGASDPVTENLTLNQFAPPSQDDDENLGDSEEWNDYTRNRRAEALNRLVKGLGIRSAQRIIDDGTTFRTKPRTWREFLNEARSALNKGLITADIHELITVTYAAENRQRLGQPTPPPRPPTPPPPTCRIIREPVRVRKYIDVPAQYGTRAGQPETRQMNAQFIRVRVEASGNIQLLPHEADILRVTVDHQGRAVVSLAKSYNDYSISQRNQSWSDIVISMVATGRSAEAELPSVGELFVQTPRVFQDSNNPNRIFLRLEVNPNFFNANPEQELDFTYVAYQTPGLNSSDYRKFENYSERTVTLNKNSRYLEIDLWGAGRQRHITVGLSGQFRNSTWFPARSFALGSYRITSK